MLKANELHEGWSGTLIHEVVGTFKCQRVLFVGKQVVVFNEVKQWGVQETVLLLKLIEIQDNSPNNNGNN